MKQEYSEVTGGVKNRLLILRGFWQVEADATYAVARGPLHWSQLIVIRTVDGEGEVTLTSGETFQLKEGSLFFLMGTELQHYRCSAVIWHFFWFQLDSIEPLEFSLNTVYPVGTVEFETELYAMVQQGLRYSESSFQQMAVAAMNLLVSHWVNQWFDKQRIGHPHQLSVDRIIALMRCRLDGSLTVTAMAEKAHLSEPQFRRVFRQVMECSPKDYYDTLRLEHGHRLLKFNRWSVSRVSVELGYSSTFHFSRAYKSRYGHAPSTLLKSTSVARRDH
jgi:AraC-like DNA-binding protein